MIVNFIHLIDGFVTNKQKNVIRFNLFIGVKFNLIWLKIYS